jgi:hypothetical protein
MRRRAGAQEAPPLLHAIGDVELLHDRVHARRGDPERRDKPQRQEPAPFLRGHVGDDPLHQHRRLVGQRLPDHVHDRLVHVFDGQVGHHAHQRDKRREHREGEVEGKRGRAVEDVVLVRRGPRVPHPFLPLDPSDRNAVGIPAVPSPSLARRTAEDHPHVERQTARTRGPAGDRALETAHRRCGGASSRTRAACSCGWRATSCSSSSRGSCWRWESTDWPTACQGGRDCGGACRSSSSWRFCWACSPRRRR